MAYLFQFRDRERSHRAQRLPTRLRLSYTAHPVKIVVSPNQFALALAAIFE